MNPKVTIIMATYNRAHFIVETLHSIQQQTFHDWECLIIDDGGTDNTKEVITPILEKDIRFQFLKRPKTYLKGLPGCRNFGLDIAKGDNIIFFDDDDIIHPDNLKISLSVIENEQVAFCHYQKKAFEKNIPEFAFKEPKIQQMLNVTFLYDVITHQIGLASCTVLWSKKCFKNLRFREELLYAEEWECYSRILSEGFEGLIIENVLYFNRKHPNSNTGEFYSNNPIRKKSKSDAALLVIKYLKEKNLLTDSIIRYFVHFSLNFKENFLFERVLNEIKLNDWARFKWIVFFKLLPLKVTVYRFKKNILKKRNYAD
jgi:glycosyltransferase involved in cell wall biosynthesis